jgi:uncharacterized protein YidB (DUF937 family)
MSGLLGQLLGKFLGGGQPQGQTPAIAGVIQQIFAQGTEGGGIAGLASRFEAAGLGPQIQSWINSGDNQPISTDQLAKVFSPDEVEGWAKQAGISPDSLLSMLTNVLPKAVDHVTPSGQLPTSSAGLATLLQTFLGDHPTSASA